ncbi:hypothetical protein KDH_60230 [Dictyobacter sp. S3.2.2.5]|uniref:Uncharacterized protein n=1 Tax=Dictyobacter halimunensis TaxID=3026934 RepID=A0ABQ6FY22_9CHLR|nr:hypothetical protein KDH_60230 [Dictyobacter sp. S3.2.2.5]
MKTLYCTTITSSALKLIRRYEGEVSGCEATICHYVHEEPSKDKHGRVIENAFKVYFPNSEAICYTLSGEISYVLP